MKKLLLCMIVLLPVFLLAGCDKGTDDAEVQLTEQQKQEQAEWDEMTTRSKNTPSKGY